ncbi:hypothetical protein Nmel_012975 [Mimus melanotis]
MCCVFTAASSPTSAQNAVPGLSPLSCLPCVLGTLKAESHPEVTKCPPPHQPSEGLEHELHS